jgi:hypothetical protein
VAKQPPTKKQRGRRLQQTAVGPVIGGDFALSSVYLLARRNMSEECSNATPPPTAVPDVYRTNMSQPLVIPAGPLSLISNDFSSSPTGDVTVTGIHLGPDDGSLVVWGKDGSFTWQPPPGFSGEVTFPYRYDPDPTATVAIWTAALNCACQTLPPHVRPPVSI